MHLHPMRRSDRQITDPEHIDSILARGRYASFALVDDRAPYIVTLSYGFDSESRRLYCHVAKEGRKLDIIARAPRACATVVIDGGYNQGQCEHPFESVVLDGTMRLVVDVAEKRHAMHVLVRQLEDDADGYWQSRDWTLEDRLSGLAVVALEIEGVTAKQGK